MGGGKRRIGSVHHNASAREDTAPAVVDAGGVVAADPVLIVHSTVGTGEPRDVNVIGDPIGGIVSPQSTAGRLPEQGGEMLADTALAVGVGESVVVGGSTFDVVGVVDNVTGYFGAPTLLIPIDGANRAPSTALPEGLWPRTAMPS